MTVLLSPAVVGIVMFFASIIWMLRDEKDRSRPILAAAVLTNLVYGAVLNAVMGQADSYFPWKYDYYLYRIDAILGFSAPAIARSLPVDLRLVLNYVYQLMLPMMFLWLAISRQRDRSSLVFAYVAEMIAGPTLYMVLPALGPAPAFGPAWLHPPHVDAVTAALSGMPNAFPSLHLATALVFVFFANTRLWRTVSLAFLGGTALSTITTGEHYVIDLVAGLSFGCFAAAMGRGKFAQATAGLALTLCGSLTIRLGSDVLFQHPALVGLWILLTIALAVYAVRTAWQLETAELHPPAAVSTVVDEGVNSGPYDLPAVPLLERRLD
jgi:hypothetical protein